MGVQKTIQQQEGQNNYKDNTATKQYNYKEIHYKALANQLLYKKTRHRKYMYTYKISHDIKDSHVPWR